MKFFRRNPSPVQPHRALTVVEGPSQEGLGHQSSLREAWIGCRLYVPSSTLTRSLGGVVVEFSSSGALVLSSDSLGRYDANVTVEFADVEDKVPCRIAGRDRVHPRVNLFELDFAVAPSECERIAALLTRCCLPYPPQTERWIGHVA